MKDRNAEIRLASEIRALKSQITKLQSEHDALERILLRMKLGEPAGEGTPQRARIRTKNIEEAIIKRLLASPEKLVSSNSLYKESVMITPTLNKNTFRSILHRMKIQEKIESPTTGRWRMPKK